MTVVVIPTNVEGSRIEGDIVMRCLHCGRHDEADRSLDVARDDSGAVNSPSTTLGMTW